MEIYALDVGQGDCTFIVPPGTGEHAILFDCNDSYVAERFIADHGVKKLTVVVSHLDQDHILGLLPLLQTCLKAGIEVDRVWIARDRALSKGRQKKVRQLLRYLDAQHLAGRFRLMLAARQDSPSSVLAADDESWDVSIVLPWWADHLAAGVVRAEDPNRVSAVLRVRSGDDVMIVGADAPIASWEALEPGLRRATVIRTPHHGGRLDAGQPTLGYEELYDSIGAELAIVSVGTNNRHGHPREVHVQAALRSGKCNVACTQLTPRCAPDPSLHRAETLLNAGGVVYPYRHRAPPGDPRYGGHARRQEVPCAGSMMVCLGTPSGVEVEPDLARWHALFVQKIDALCLPLEETGPSRAEP